MGDSYQGITVPEGDPAALENVASDFSSLAGATSSLSTRLSAAPGQLGGWQGPASFAFTGVSLMTSASASLSSANFAVAAQEARRYSDDLREAKEETRQAIEEAREAQTRIDRAEREIERAQERRGEAQLRYLWAAAQLLVPDITGSSAASARNDMAAAQKDIDAADEQERRARLELDDAREDLERAKRRGARAEAEAERAAMAASNAFAAVGAGLPGDTPVPGSAAYGVPGSGTAPALTPFSQMVTGAGFGDKAKGSGGPFGPLAPILAGLNTAPSTDYRSFQDPERRLAEQEMLFGGAEPATEVFDIEDLEGVDEGKLRLGLFIAAPTAGASGLPHTLGLQRGEGNNRGFDPQFSPNQTKGYIELDFKNDTAYILSNPSCNPDGSDCEDAKDIAQDDILNFGDLKTEVEPNDTDGDEVHISWEFSNSKGAFRGDLPGIDLPGSAGPSIDGDLHVKPGPDGVPIVELDGDDYPSREVYYDDGQGRTYELIKPRLEDDGEGIPGDGTMKLLPGIN